MNIDKDLNVPISSHGSHSHDYDFYESFAATRHTNLANQHDQIMAELRREFYSTDDAPNKRTR
jgi:hypothetical protein